MSDVESIKRKGEMLRVVYQAVLLGEKGSYVYQGIMSRNSHGRIILIGHLEE